MGPGEEVTPKGTVLKRSRASGQVPESHTGHLLWQPSRPGPHPARTWASWSSGSSDVEPLVWTLPLGSLVSMRAGDPGLEEAGAPFSRACAGRSGRQLPACPGTPARSTLRLESCHGRLRKVTT